MLTNTLGLSQSLQVETAPFFQIYEKMTKFQPPRDHFGPQWLKLTRSCWKSSGPIFGGLIYLR